MRLSIIIIEYHCMDQVQDCLQSIQTHLSEIEYECFIISNSEYSETDLASHCKSISGATMVNTGNNLGYAGGVNIGISHASGDYIYVLNPDCLLTDSNINQIMYEMDKESDWAISGPKVVDQNYNVQPSCRAFPRPWTFLMVRSILSRFPGAASEKGRYLMDAFDHNSLKEVDWVSGGATLVKAEVLNVIGGMDERYFLYMEDVDWCRGCWRKGYKVKYMPVSTVIHAGQHQSIKLGLKMFSNIHLRWHLISMFKYFIKGSLLALPGNNQ
ncbi:MAG TPA: glycosyltransferase family 2 protein [Gammaproteobacteria bacterium]